MKDGESKPTLGDVAEQLGDIETLANARATMWAVLDCLPPTENAREALISAIRNLDIMAAVWLEGLSGRLYWIEKQWPEKKGGER